MRTPDLDALTAGLSGGNQQKLVLAKWLAARCRVLILDEPTRGVDVGAKAEIHALIGRLAAEGTGVLLISSELPELVALSTRILVLRDGRLVGELAREEADHGVVAADDGGPRSARQAPARLIIRTQSCGPLLRKFPTHFEPVSCAQNLDPEGHNYVFTARPLRVYGPPVVRQELKKPLRGYH